jgi:DNA replication protein DnaC
VTSRLETPAHAGTVAAHEGELAADEAGKRAYEAAANAKALWLVRGKRYERCTLDNFRLVGFGALHGNQKQQVVQRLRSYAKNITWNILHGVGVVLIGPPGTGKDHLMAALMHAALAAGHTVKWASGPRLFARFRDDIGGDAEEWRTVAQYTKPDVFALSDPTWEQSRLERFQRAKLMEIIDGRYNALKPTWVTLNVAGRAEADSLIGAAIVDRLVDGALSLECNWPSYRKSVTVFELTGPDRRRVSNSAGGS